MSSLPTLGLIVGLSDPKRRLSICEVLAQRVQVELVLLFVRDPALKVLIPAPGMSQTVRGGRSWRAFLAGCPHQGRCNGVVEVPIDTKRRALALLHDGTGIILLGGQPNEDEVAELEAVLPLLAALLASEQHTLLARAEARAAHDATSRAHELARALDAARAEASALNAEFREEHRRKDEFLAMLGHELRNPLAPLVAIIGLLRSQTSEERKITSELLEIMTRQITQLSRLVDDLLDVSRVSRGRIDLRRERLSLSDIVLNAYEECWPLIETKQHEVVIEGTDVPMFVNADRARLMQIFGNLLNNAAKYTDIGGKITIKLYTDEHKAYAIVSDNGIGLAPEVLPRVFDLFTQSSPALGRAEGGLGIGLTLVRRLVELHGGQVMAASNGIGQGASFTVALPLAVAEEVPDNAVQQANQGKTDKSLRIIVVDDNRDAADSIALLLRSMGHATEVAYDGREALRCATKIQADVILVDIAMPDMDGYEVVRQLRLDVKRNTRLIALTGYGTDEGKQRSREAGFDAHIVKPIKLETLREILAE